MRDSVQNVSIMILMRFTQYGVPSSRSIVQCGYSMNVAPSKLPFMCLQVLGIELRRRRTIGLARIW